MPSASHPLFPVPLLNCSFPVLNEEVQIDHPREPHQPGLYQYNNNDAGSQKIIDAVVHIAQSENGPVPDKVQKKQHHGKRIIDAAAIVALVDQLLSAYRTVCPYSQELAQGEDTFLLKNIAFPAVRAFVGKQSVE
jgi:hypothetical protein